VALVYCGWIEWSVAGIGREFDLEEVVDGWLGGGQVLVLGVYGEW